MDRSHQTGVQCIWTVTLVCLFFELLPFVDIHTWIFSVASLQTYTSYGYEILWVDRSHQGAVQCTWTVALACLIFELLPFVYFHTWFCPDHISVTILAMVMKFCGWIDHIKGECSAHEPKLLLYFFFELLPLVYFHTWILSSAYLQNYTSYGYEILLVDRSHQGSAVQMNNYSFAKFLSYCPLFIFILEFCPEHISKTVLAMVMKFCGWIDLIMRECSAHEL